MRRPHHEHDEVTRKVTELHVDHVGAEEKHHPETEGNRRDEQYGQKSVSDREGKASLPRVRERDVDRVRDEHENEHRHPQPVKPVVHEVRGALSLGRRGDEVPGEEKEKPHGKSLEEGLKKREEEHRQRTEGSMFLVKPRPEAAVDDRDVGENDEDDHQGPEIVHVGEPRPFRDNPGCAVFSGHVFHLPGRRTS
jgi:hypothetical protein